MNLYNKKRVTNIFCLQEEIQKNGINFSSGGVKWIKYNLKTGCRKLVAIIIVEGEVNAKVFHLEERECQR